MRATRYVSPLHVLVGGEVTRSQIDHQDMPAVAPSLVGLVEGLLAPPVVPADHRYLVAEPTLETGQVRGQVPRHRPVGPGPRPDPQPRAAGRNQGRGNGAALGRHG